jgi:pimeloyl-ACP methyl ester carboxylesterase
MHSLNFPSGGDQCAASYLPATTDTLVGPDGWPCVVMAHGFGGTRDCALLGFAEGFAAAGLDVLAFDYRGFADSTGSPRQLVSHRRQRRDYHAAIAAARKMSRVDPERIVLWGTSYSGGHVVAVAARDGRVAGAISMTPAMDGVAALAQMARTASPREMRWAITNGLRDALRGATGRAPHHVPIVARPGSAAVFTAPGAEEALLAVAGPAWRNAVCARSVFGLPFNRPIRSAPRLECPLLIQVGTEDTIAPTDDARRTAAKAGHRAELREYPVDHLDVYDGPGRDKMLSDQIDFARRAVGPMSPAAKTDAV